MRKLSRVLLLYTAVFCLSIAAYGQDDQRAAWQVVRFEISATATGAERSLGARANLTLKNVGRGSGSGVTLRISPNAEVTAVRVGNAAANFRSLPEARGNLQRISVTLPAPVAANGTTTVSVDYKLAVESNSGAAALSPAGSQFLPVSSWYPQPNTLFSLRGADTAPIRITVTGPSGQEVVSSGKAGASFEQSLAGQPFFVTGRWDTVEGVGEATGITAYLPKGASAEERKEAEKLIAYAQAARVFFSSILGPVSDAPIRLVTVARGAGFNDAGTVLIDDSSFKRGRIDSNTATLVAESVARLWIGARTPVRGEGSGVIREGLPRYLATLFIGKQFGAESGAAERARQRLAYSVISKRDAPLAITTPLDDTYFVSVSNKGAILWELVDKMMGSAAFTGVLRSQIQGAATADAPLTLVALRGALAQAGGASVKSALDALLDQPTDMNLLVGLPQQRGGQWSAALRNTGAIDAKVNVVAVTDRGERLSVEQTIPAKGFAEAVFTTGAKVVRVEVDPDKIYPQLDYTDDVSPRVGSLDSAIAESNLSFSRQEYAKAEARLRETLAVYPSAQEARVLLGRTLIALNRHDEAEKEFNAALAMTLPTASTLAWANVGLGEIELRRGQGPASARHYAEAVRDDAEYGSTLAARAGRIQAESIGGSAPAVDESAKAFIAQLDQAIRSGRKTEIEALIVPGELTAFVKGIVGTQPEVWQTRAVRSEALDADRLAVDVAINAKQLGKEESGTAVLMLVRSGGTWKLNSIEFFEVR
jgi:tetratricopeptide (TPR) repeat protein